MAIIKILLEPIAYIHCLTVLQKGSKIALMKRNSIDENGGSSGIEAPVSNVKLQVFSLFSYALGVAVIDEVARDKDGARIARPIRL